MKKVEVFTSLLLHLPYNKLGRIGVIKQRGDLRMIVPNQKVKVKWVKKSRNHYENKGYIFTKWYEEFTVHVDHLSEGANSLVKCNCDNIECSEVFFRKYCNVIKAYGKTFCTKKCKDLIAKRQIYTNEDLINEFWRFYYENKRYPNSTDFRNDPSYPNPSTINRRIGTWDDYLKEVGVVDKNTTDGWYIHDEAIIRKYYPDDKIDIIMNKLMVKREKDTIRAKASDMGLRVKHEIRYKPKYNNEETRLYLISFAKDFYNKKGRSPYRFELGLPRNAIEQNWLSYNDFLIECELPIFRREVELKNKEDGIIFLRELKKELGRNPYISDVDKRGVNKNWFRKIFGSYRQALFDAGLIALDELNEQLKLDNSIEYFKEMYSSTGKVPKFHEYKIYAAENKLFSPSTFIEKLNVSSYTELCRKLIGESNVLEYDKNEMIEELISLKEKLGRVPMGKELSENGLPSFYVYKYVFNKRYFNDVIRDLGWEPSGQDSLYKSDEELLEDYQNLYEKLGRIPLRDDIDEEDSMCHSGTYISRFESISNVCEILDLNYNELIAESFMGSGTSCFDKNGDICRSIPEMKITNLLIENCIKYIKEYPYGNVTNNLNDKRRFDWYLPELNIYIEYFGLFDKNRIDSECRNGVYARKAFKKIDDCKNLGIKLIDLYPKDNKSNFKNLINKIIINDEQSVI
ncbi:hypothetical protein [uncultured Metabacillus sp.]|uniref:homing endonuclease associated repeat-containing protein n=1 Tax=uncultured Metabacillus sp. TaxID=2860135 RepID=UPI002614E73C|nr:hypothetical protein [uncultured Metabacillus sp.]